MKAKQFFKISVRCDDTRDIVSPVYERTLAKARAVVKRSLSNFDPDHDIDIIPMSLDPYVSPYDLVLWFLNRDGLMGNYIREGSVIESTTCTGPYRAVA